MRIRVIDLETTGDAPPEHGVCEIGWCDVTNGPKGSNWVVDDAPHFILTNPGRSIPPETAAVHHIIDDDVAEAEPWRDVAQYVLQSSGDILAAHSAKFERKFITADMTGDLKWICTYKCAMRLWPEAPRHSNNVLRYWRNPTGLVRELAVPSHRAGPDAYVTAFHLRDMLEMAPIEKLIEWSNQPALQTICHIGKERGKRWADIDGGFLRWLLDKDFDEDVLFTARTELKRREDALRDPNYGDQA